ncbi:MAG: putative rane protein involved in export of O-antigen [Tardiphaga sp.]|nr:putative rane protein involved in export of O-antigen [Tardiphaga sp.]
MTIATSFPRLNAIWTNPALRAIGGVFLLRITITAFSFFLITLAARAMTLSSFGTYSILFSAAGLFCIIATVGQQVLLMRSWNEYSANRQLGLLKGALIFAGLVCGAASVLVAVPFYAWFAVSQGAAIALWVTLYLVALSVLLTTSHLVRTAIGVGIGDGVGNLALTVPPTIYLSWILLTGAGARLDVIFFLLATGAMAGIAWHVASISRLIRRTHPDFAATPAAFDWPAWRVRSLKLWLSNSLEASNQYLDVLIVGALMSPGVAGAYFVTSRLANAFAMATDAIHMFSTRHIPDLYYRKKFAELGALLDHVAGVTLLVVVTGMAVVIGAGHWMLMVFSAAYVPYYSALVTLSIGMVALAASGPSGSILMLTGHESRYLGIIGASVLLRIVGFAVLIPPFGVMGAVVATTLSFVFMASMLTVAAKAVTGIDGSVLRLRDALWRRRAVAEPNQRV